MKRREFFIRVGGAMLAVPAVLQVTACGGDDDDDDDDTGGPDASGNLTSFSGTGSGSGHSHTFTVQCTDLSSNSDVQYTSSSSGGHTHMFSLTVAQLGMLAAGSTVTFDTTDLHAHSWTVSKPSNAC